MDNGSKTAKVTDGNFDELVMKSDKLVLVDFWAEWCGPCRMLGPVVEELAKENEDKVLVCKMDVDTNQETAIKYSIRSIPTILFFKNGEIVEKSIGVSAKNFYQSKINSLSTNNKEDVEKN